jgi:hypothetical protein
MIPAIAKISYSKMLNNTFKIVYLILLIFASIIRAFGVNKSKNWWKNKDRIAQNRNTLLDRILLGFVFLGMHIHSPFFMEYIPDIPVSELDCRMGFPGNHSASISHTDQTIRTDDAG